MGKTPRRHSNQDFSRSISLTLADMLLAGILGTIFLGIAIEEEKGLQISLPLYHYETEDTIKISSSNILHLEIDSTSQLKIDEVLYSYPDAAHKIYEFLLHKLISERKPYIWIKVSRQSRYRNYIRLRNEIKRAERKILDELSIRYYGIIYSDDFPSQQRKKIQKELSLCIIEEDERGKPYFEIRPFADCNKEIKIK